MPTWVDVSLDDVDSNSPIKVDLIQHLVDLQQKLISIPIMFQFNQVISSSSSMVTVYSAPLFIPPFLEQGTAGTPHLLIGLQAFNNGGTDYSVEVDIGNTVLNSGLLSNSTYEQDIEFDLTSGDTKSAANTIVTVTIKAQKNGGGTVRLRARGGISRIVYNA